MITQKNKLFQATYIQENTVVSSIFSHIISGAMSAHVVAETDYSMAFLDIFPETYGHTLVVPKQQVASFDALSTQSLHDLIELTQRVAKAVMQAMETSAYNLVLNNGKLAKQEVMHVHFHVVPRYDAGAHTHQRKQAYPEGKADEIAAKIKAAL